MVPTEELEFPLDVAARNGHLEVVRELVDRVGINGCTSAGGESALIEAASLQHANVVAFLCDVDVVDTDGSALGSAVEGKSEECVKLLLRHRGGHGNISAYTYMNIPQRLGLLGSPLACTFCLGGFYSPRIARLLIEAGADTTSDVLVEDNDGDNDGGIVKATPTHLAEMVLRRGLGTDDTTGEDGAEILDGLRLVIRLLHQVSAVHANSWLWPRDFPIVGIGGAAQEKSEKKSTPTIVRMLPPVLKRRATRKPRMLMAALSR